MFDLSVRRFVFLHLKYNYISLLSKIVQTVTAVFASWITKGFIEVWTAYHIDVRPHISWSFLHLSFDRLLTCLLNLNIF